MCVHRNMRPTSEDLKDSAGSGTFSLTSQDSD